MCVCVTVSSAVFSLLVTSVLARTLSAADTEMYTKLFKCVRVATLREQVFITP